MLLMRSPASLSVPLLPPSFFSGVMSRAVWESETGWLLALVVSVLSRHVHTGISNVREAFNACIRLQLRGTRNNFTEIVNQDLVLRGASS